MTALTSFLSSFLRKPVSVRSTRLVKRGSMVEAALLMRARLATISERRQSGL